MRKALLFVAFVLVAACNGRPLTDTCPTVTQTGTATSCVVTSQCVSTNKGVKLDCTQTDGNCTCYENDIAGKTVPFNSVYCDTNASKEGVLENANAACDWKL
jgi:archaellin